VPFLCEKHSKLVAGFLGDFGRSLEGMHSAAILNGIVLRPKCVGFTIFAIE
jgi:hypothetical protein